MHRHVSLAGTAPCFKHGWKEREGDMQADCTMVISSLLGENGSILYAKDMEGLSGI